MNLPTPHTGTALGLTAAAESFQPSLMPTPAIDQGIVAGATLATSGLAARLVEAGIGAGTRSTGLPDVAVRGAVIAVGAGTAVAFQQRKGESLGRAAVRTAGTVMAAAAATGAAVRVVKIVGKRVAERIPGGRWIVPTATALEAAAVGAYVVKSRLDRFEADGRPQPELESVAKSIAVAGALSGGVTAVISAQRAGVRAVAGRTPAPLAVKAFGHSASLAAVAGTAAFGLRTLIGKIESGNNRIEGAYADPPGTTTVTAGPDSPVAFDSLGLQGRRFVSSATPGESITALMGEPPRAEPVRVYVGWASAPDLESRVDLAIEELRRTGGFERSLLIVVSPAGTGYANYIPIEAAEYMARGDVATVTIQYGRRPSLMSADRITPGAHHHRLLLEAIAAERARTGSGPRIMLYGESLGAHTSQDAFLHEGTNGLTDLGIAGALWVGTPHRSEWKEQVWNDDRPDTDRSIFARFNSIGDVRALDRAARDTLRIYFLDHHNDPVTKFGIDLAVQKPEWLGPPTERPATVPHTQQWLPLVTFWQTIIDTKNAATVIPGEFFATGHDYRADLAEFVREAFEFDDVSAEQMERIEAQLRASEIDRADRIARS